MRIRRQQTDQKFGPRKTLALGRDFRLFAIGQAVSLAGDRIALITLVFLVIRLSGGYAPALALFYVCRVLPTFLGGLLVGALVDQVDRRRLLIACDVGRALLLVAASALGTTTLSSLYPLVVALYALSLAFNTAATAALPDVVPELRMLAANSVLTGIQSTADFAYALGGALVLVLGVRLPLYIDAGSFIFSAVMITAMRIPHHSVSGRSIGEGARQRIVAGWRFIWQNAFLKWSTVAMTVAPLAGGIAFVLTPLYATVPLAHSAGLVGPLRSGAFRFSVLEVSLGVGALVGSVAAPYLARRYARGLIFGLGLAGTGTAQALLAPTNNLYLAVLLVVCDGICFTLAMITSGTLVQVLTPTELRGRVTATRFTIVNGALLAGAALGGAFLLVLSVQSLWILVGGTIAASGIALCLQPQVRSQR